MRKKGFTLVELSLAMAFLAVLLITISILVIRIISIYQAGLSIRAVNATGRQLVDDFTRAISGSPIDDIGYNASAESTLVANLGANDKLTHKYFFQKVAPSMTIEGEVRKNVQLAGGFCTGRYSYLWNTAYGLQSGSGFSFNGNSSFRLLRIYDSGRAICGSQRVEGNRINPARSAFSNPSGIAPVELLADNEDDLAIYDLRVFPATRSNVTGHIYYSATFILATLRGGVDIFANGDFCTAEASTTLATDFNYCAINKFNFAIRATGRTPDDASNIDQGFGR